jgi:hypothetical protein
MSSGYHDEIYQKKLTHGNDLPNCPPRDKSARSGYTENPAKAGCAVVLQKKRCVLLFI